MKTRDPVGQPGSILLVEDDPDAGEGLCRLLRSRGGFEVVREHDAEGALCRSGAGDTVAILTLTRGARGGDQAQRARESQQAADLIGARLFLDDLDDTHIAEGNPTIDIIEQVVAEIRPTVVYTHSLHDVHQD